MAEVLVLVDHVDGEIKKNTYEMLTAARRLASVGCAVSTGCTSSSGSSSASRSGESRLTMPENESGRSEAVRPRRARTRWRSSARLTSWK